MEQLTRRVEKDISAALQKKFGIIIDGWKKTVVRQLIIVYFRMLRGQR